MPLSLSRAGRKMLQSRRKLVETLSGRVPRWFLLLVLWGESHLMGLSIAAPVGRI